MTLRRSFAAAAADRTRGAAEIELRLLRELLEQRADWRLEALIQGGEMLLAGQPAMANLRSLAHRFSGCDEQAADRFVRRRLAMLGELNERFAVHAWPLLGGVSTVVSISRSSAVAAVLAGAHGRGWDGRAVIFDGAASGGGTAQAELLHNAGLDVISQPDALTREWLDRDGVLVLSGADALSDLRVVNAVGTGLLLELARARGVPAVVVADSAKLLVDVELDEMVAAGDMHEEPGPGRRWPRFEAYPRRLLSWWVDENGIRPP